jgi:GAF domain-containing protein
MLAWLQWRVTGELLRRGVHGERSMTEEDDRLVDRDGFDRLPGLRRALPDPGSLFATLQRVIDATRAVFQVDGASLALEHEDGSLRWVVVTDGGAGLLEDAQRDLGEGPGLAAYAEEAAVAVIDLATDRRFARLAAVVTPGGLRGVLAVPVAVAGRPVGALSVYATQPCPWSGIDVAAVGAYAGVVAELVAASMALDARDAEVAELTQALSARVWVEQAKGALVATEGLDPAVASERLRARAEASQRTLADVAREVVQDAQRDRTAVIAVERARSRAAEARAEHAEAALEAAHAETNQKDAEADGPPTIPGHTTTARDRASGWL